MGVPATNSMVPDYLNPPDIASFLAADLDRWRGIVKALAMCRNKDGAAYAKHGAVGL
jgi:hypothetical protein